jgi:hypothetical protein
MESDYADLRSAIEAAGFHSTLQPILVVGDRIVLASERAPDGLHGNSFWVARRLGDWFVATWAPKIYRLGNVHRLVELCLHLLHRRPAGAYAAIEPDVVAEFNLTEVADDEFPDAE